MADIVRDLSRIPEHLSYLRRMRRSVDGPLRERVTVAKRALDGGGWWRQPMRLPARGAQRPSSQIAIGERVFVGRHAWINLTSAEARLRLGDGVLMSDRVTSLDQLHDFRSWVAEAVAAGRDPVCDWGLTDAAPVAIGSGTWLGIGVVVLPGVTIGKGCAVGANAVVTRDLPDHSVAVGVPARIIGSAVQETRDPSVTQL